MLLEVTEDALAGSPKIEHLFKSIGGSEKVIEFLAGSEEPEARAIVELRRRLNRDQAKAVPFEAYCIAANVPTKKMFGIIAAEAADQSAKATSLLADATHPMVVEATVKNALDPLGSKDREMLHKAKGFVPIPKTAVTFVKNMDARQQTQVNVLPPVEDAVRRLSDRFNNGMDVPALPPPQDIIDAEEEETDDE